MQKIYKKFVIYTRIKKLRGNVWKQKLQEHMTYFLYHYQYDTYTFLMYYCDFLF